MTDDRAVYIKALKATAIELLGGGSVAVGIFWASGHAATAAAVAAGVGVAAFIGLGTQASILLGTGKDAAIFGAIVAGTWLAKLVIVVAGMVALTRLTSLPRVPLVLAMLAAVVVTLAIDVWAVVRTRVPYANPGSNTRG